MRDAVSASETEKVSKVIRRESYDAVKRKPDLLSWISIYCPRGGTRPAGRGSGQTVDVNMILCGSHQIAPRASVQAPKVAGGTGPNQLQRHTEFLVTVCWMICVYILSSACKRFLIFLVGIAEPS